MSVRVVARIRPLLQSENKKDAIVEAIGPDDASSARPSIVKIPNPKNLSEDFTFQFNGVYDEQATQQELFDAEGGSPGDPLHELELTARSSDAYSEASLSWFRCHHLRIRLHRHRKDTHHAWRKVTGRSRHDSEAAKQHLSP